jgi:hypothetical protein
MESAWLSGLARAKEQGTQGPRHPIGWGAVVTSTAGVLWSPQWRGAQRSVSFSLRSVFFAQCVPVTRGEVCYVVPRSEDIDLK